MSFLDNIEKSVGGLMGQSNSGNSDILEHVMSLVNDPQNGGLQGLVQQFHSNGLGEVVNSWIGNGANQPITGDQIAQVVGQDKLNDIATKLGIQPDEVSSLVAQHLPNVIDKLTPTGQAS